MSNENYDALFIGAHPDDVEIYAGGTVAKMTDAGRRVMICDVTLGEMASRGSVEERIIEAKDAASVLKADRTNLKLPDGRLQYVREDLVKGIVKTIRELRPRFVFTHTPGDHHPDHNAVSEATRFACFQATVLNYETGQERHQVGRLFNYVYSRKRMPARPDLILDTTDTHERKKEALKCYRSQLANPEYKGAPTYVSSDQAWQMIDAMGAFIGGLSGANFGEAFIGDTPVLVDDLFLIRDSGI